MRDKLGGKMMKEFFALRAKTYCYLSDNNEEEKKPKICQRLHWALTAIKEYNQQIY